MLYTIIDIYEVMRTDEIYPAAVNSSAAVRQERICTDPYKYIKQFYGG